MQNRVSLIPKAIFFTGFILARFLVVDAEAAPSGKADLIRRNSNADFLWRNTISGEYAFWLMKGAATTSAFGFNLPTVWELKE